jgi:hypothetical protein
MLPETPPLHRHPGATSSKSVSEAIAIVQK